MQFLQDAQKLNGKLSSIFIEFEEKIPHLYKLSELYIDNNNPTKKLKREFLFLRRSLGFLKSILIALFRSCFNRRTISTSHTNNNHTIIINYGRSTVTNTRSYCG